MLFALLGCFLTLKAQDTLLVYDLRTKRIELIAPVPYDTASHAGQMPSSLGLMGNKQPLSLTQPSGQFYPGTQFTQPQPAAELFDLTAFPMRAAMKIFGVKNGALDHVGSGMMVGETMVLAAAHLFVDINNCNPAKWLFDSLKVAPAYNNGKFQDGLPISAVKKIYLFKSFYQKCLFLKNDVALLELHEPIGRKIGYMGIAFNDDPGFYKQKIFHKFSYPGTYDYFVRPPRHFNGDTLYYNAGPIEKFTWGKADFLGVANAWSVPGQSGSSIFYTDNEAYHTYGVMVLSTDMFHHQFTNHEFYQFQHVIDQVARVPPTPLYRSALYPNPFRNTATLEFENRQNEKLLFNLFDSTGRLVQEVQNISGSLLTINRSGLAAGLYFYKLYTPDQVYTSGKLIIE